MTHAHDSRCGWYTPPTCMHDELVFAAAIAYGYTEVKLIGEQRALVGLNDYLTTRGIVFIDPRDGGVIRRYCYQNREEATQALVLYIDPQQHPSGNWIKHKGWFQHENVDDLNPNWCKPEIDPITHHPSLALFFWKDDR